MSEKQYVTWDDADGFEKALADTSDNVDAYDGILHSNASIGRTFIDTGTNISTRSAYNKSDYDYYRQSEAVPRSVEGKMHMCDLAYENVSIVRNVIDMMADFTVQGIRITHPNKSIENFYKNWAKTVDLFGVSERICNTLYRLGNCPVKTRMGKVPVKVEKEWKSTHGSEDIKFQKQKVEKRTIPLAYDILNPLTIEVIGGELSSFIGNPIYALKISAAFRLMMNRLEVNSVKNEEIADMLKIIPDSMMKAIKGGRSVVPLDQSKFDMLFYRKDDWKVWATPMLGSILNSLAMLEKMHLADSSALDGAISNIRLWRLGDIENKILPTKSHINKLRSILASSTTGSLDLVWGPELDFKESNSQVHNYLKPEKYRQVMTEIYAGLGVPSSLSGGGAGGDKGFTNNFIAMKTLVERLEYVRNILTCFWNTQLKKIQKSMGFRHPAKVGFDYKVLNDDISERNLLLNMWDRNIVSTETIRELSKRDPDMETLRVNREERSRDAGKTPQKASPYHNPDWELDLKKILLQGGGVVPSEIGLILEEANPKEVSKIKQMEESQVNVSKFKPVGVSGEGRPKNKKDSTKRKPKKVNPRTSANFTNTFLWANEAQKTISSMLSEFFMSYYSKKNLRSLSKSEVKSCEDLKFQVLASLDPFEDINREKVYNNLKTVKHVSVPIQELSTALIHVFAEKNDREPTIEEMRQIQSSAFSIHFDESNEDLEEKKEKKEE